MAASGGRGRGQGRRSAQNAREKFLHLTNRDREGVAHLLSLSLLPPPCSASSQAARAPHSRCSTREASDNETLGPGHAIESPGNIAYICVYMYIYIRLDDRRKVSNSFQLFFLRNEQNGLTLMKGGSNVRLTNGKDTVGANLKEEKEREIQ